MRVAARGDARLLVPSANEGAAGAPPAGLAGLLGRLPFASIGLGAGGGAAPLTEKRTGTAFPEELEYCAGQRGCPVVTGAG